MSSSRVAGVKQDTLKRRVARKLAFRAVQPVGRVRPAHREDAHAVDVEDLPACEVDEPAGHVVHEAAVSLVSLPFARFCVRPFLTSGGKHGCAHLHVHHIAAVQPMLLTVSCAGIRSVAYR